jgi:hypothetical protein
VVRGGGARAADGRAAGARAGWSPEPPAACAEAGRKVARGSGTRFTGAGAAQVHYIGWPAHMDEWIPLDGGLSHTVETDKQVPNLFDSNMRPRPTTGRLSRLHTYTPRDGSGVGPAGQEGSGASPAVDRIRSRSRQVRIVHWTPAPWTPPALEARHSLAPLTAVLRGRRPRRARWPARRASARRRRRRRPARSWPRCSRRLTACCRRAAACSAAASPTA